MDNTPTDYAMDNTTDPATAWTTPARQRHYPPSNFGPILKRARRARGWGLRQAARRIGIDPGYLSKLEYGHRCPSESVAYDLVGRLRIEGADRAVVLATAIPDVGRDWCPPDPQTAP